MPDIRLPIVLGLVTDQTEGEWLDFLPVNMVSVPKPVLGGQGYMRSWPGLTQTVTTPGGARGGVYNTVRNIVYRVAGTSLIDNEGQTLADVGGFGLARMPFSVTSQAIVSMGRLRYFRDNTLTDLQNWAEDERSNDWVPDLNNSHITLPVFNPNDDVILEASFELMVPTSNVQLFEDSTTANGTRVFITPGRAVGFSPNVASTAQTTANNAIAFGAIQRLRIVYDNSANTAQVFVNNISRGTLSGFTGTFDKLDTFGSRAGTSIRGALYNVRFTDVTTTANTRFYPMIITSENRPTTVTVNTDPPVDANRGTLVNFPSGSEWIRGIFTPTAPTDFDLGFVIDAVRNRGRYIWIMRNSGRFGVTDLINEQRPDYIAPFYSAEAEPDQNIAVDAWKGYVVIFGRYTIEYFGLTGNPQQIYAPVQSLTVRAGIVGLGCKTHYLDSFAILGGPDFESPSVYLIGQGSYQEIASRRIQKILRSYTIEEIQRGAFMEPVKFDAHDFLVIHLPEDVLIYDHNASRDGHLAWTRLKTDINREATYRGLYHINDGDRWTAADKRQNILSRFSFTNARHIGQDVEYIVHTTLVQVRNKRLFDLQVDTVPGRTLEASNMSYATTFDGITYSAEHFIRFNTPRDYTRRVLARRLGYVRNNVGFRLRWTTGTPSTLSDFRVRVE